MSLRDRILSDTNIYAAIHALPNTLREKSLICADDAENAKQPGFYIEPELIH